MNTPLCIIDMQPFFEDTACVALPGTLHEIRQAKARKAPIILVEYYDLGPSYDSINELLDGYKIDANTSGVIRVTKFEDGGGHEIYETVGYHGIDLNQRIRVCGVNRSFCVHDTLYELKQHLEHVEFEISEPGTWCEEPVTGINMLGDLGCIVVGT